MSHRLLYNEVENLAFVIDRTPEEHTLCCDLADQASGAGELLPRPLLEPDVILSHHLAPTVRPRGRLAKPAPGLPPSARPR